MGVLGMLVTFLIILGIIGVGVVGWIAPMLFLIAGLRLQSRLSECDELSSVKNGDTVKGKDINLSLLFQKTRQNFVSNVTFKRCILKGPCVVTLKGENKFCGCGFLGTTRLEAKLLMKPNDDKSYTVVGIGEFVHCKFQYCNFKNVAFYVTKKEYDNLLSKIVQV